MGPPRDKLEGGASSADSRREWPFYKISEDEGGMGWPWPAVGWRGLTLEDEAFNRDFKFFLLDEGPFDMRPAEAVHLRIPDPRP